MSGALLLWVLMGLLLVLLLAYVLNPKFRAGVDADTAARKARRAERSSANAHSGMQTGDPDAEIWPDPPADPSGFDRWFAANGSGADPRDR